MQNSIIERSKAALLANYGRLDIAVSRGDGALFWDTTGARYIDLFAGFGAAGVLGHAHPLITEAVTSQIELLSCHGNLFTNEPQVNLAERLLKHSLGKGKVFFCHSGSEANEAALKLARKRKPERDTVISFDACFHGRTMGSLSLCPQSFQDGFGPMLERNRKVAFNDLKAFEATIDERTSAVFMEVIQGEGGVNIPSEEFIHGVRALCTAHDALLVVDEVWTAPARTGRYFAYQHFGIQPDVITVAKAIGGGLPLAACIISDSHSAVLGPGSHGCTMGGNPVCAAAALRSLELIEELHLCDRAMLIEQHLRSLVAQASTKGIREVRGRGAFLAIALEDTIPNQEVMKRALEHGVHICIGKGNVLRVAPPLIIDETLLKEGISTVLQCIRTCYEQDS